MPPKAKLGAKRAGDSEEPSSPSKRAKPDSDDVARHNTDAEEAGLVQGTVQPKQPDTVGDTETVVNSGGSDESKTKEVETSGRTKTDQEGAQTEQLDDAHTIKGVDYVSKEHMSRLYLATKHCSVKNLKYCLVDTPLDKASWGSGGAGQQLCIASNPISVFFVARVVRTRFINTNADEVGPPRSAAIYFRFVRDVDDQMGRKLTYENSKPATVCSKSMFEARCPTVRGPKMYYFSEIYDGTKHMGPKQGMARIKHYDVKANDIVVIEARIQRYNPQSKRNWAEGWVANFFLVSISKLYNAAMNVDDPDESDMEEPRVLTDDEMEGF